MSYIPSADRYQNGMKYRLCGHSGLYLPQIALGLWQNFGRTDDHQTSQAILEQAFDRGITYFDLANNYGNPPGSAEETFGEVFHQSFVNHRDEMIVATKAGHRMWEGSYGDGCSRKSLVASLNQSLKRLRMDYVDIYYTHRYDGITPIEETMQALADIVKSGKALYVGLSKYPPALAEKGFKLLASYGVPCLIYQDRYNALTTGVEQGGLEAAQRNGVGFCAFSPLAQGLLTDRYLSGIPSDSRIAKNSPFLKKDSLTPERLSVLQSMNSLAHEAGLSLAQLALYWLLNQPAVTSVLVGVSSVSQLNDNLLTLNKPKLDTQLLSTFREIATRFPGF